MEYVKVTDEWLYKYMPVVDAAIIWELEKQVNTEYHFSRKFERRMKRLIRQEAHPWIGAAQNTLKKAALFFIGVISLTLILTMSVEAHRVKFFKTIKTIFEDSFMFSYFTESDTYKLANREPTYIPDGYQETDRTENENYLSIVYENDKGEMLLWDQMLVTDSGSMIFDMEYDEEYMKEIYGSVATVLIYKNGYKCIYYEYEDYSYIVVTESLCTDELYRMIESIINNEKDAK